MDNAPHQLHLLRVLGRVRHDRFHHLHPTTQHPHTTVGAVGNGIDQLVIDPVDLVQELGHFEDFAQRLFGEDRAFLHLQHQHNSVGAAKRRRVLVVHLDKRVVLGQQLVKARHEI